MVGETRLLSGSELEVRTLTQSTRGTLLAETPTELKFQTR